MSITRTEQDILNRRRARLTNADSTSEHGQRVNKKLYERLVAGITPQQRKSSRSY